jgi:predicted  nucleic acid-binding Zn-ribbon protein
MDGAAMSTQYDRSGGQPLPVEPPLPADGRNPRSLEDSSFANLRDNVIEALRILALRRWTFFIPFCLVTCGLAIGSHWLKRTYRSSTVIERRDHPVLMNLRQTAATGEFSRFFRPTLERDIRSMDAMSEVVVNLELVNPIERDANGEFTEETARAIRHKAASLMGGVSARVVKKNEHFDEIRISYECAQPYLAKSIVGEVKDAYVRNMRATLIEMLTEGMAYFQGQADQRRDEIARYEEDILRFEAQYLGVDPTNPGALKLKLTSLESERQELARDIESLKSEVRARREMIALYQQRAAARAAQLRARSQRELVGGAVPRHKSDQTRAVEDEIRRLQSEVHDLQLTRRMTDRHPDIIERRDRIARLRADLKARYLADAQAEVAGDQAELTDAEADVAVEQAVGLDMELVNLRMELQGHEGRLASAESRLRTIDEDIARHEELQRNVFHYRKDYQLKADQLVQARKDRERNMIRVNDIASILSADESQRGVSFTVQSPPSGGIRPIRPKGITILACAILAGLAAGAVGVLIREVFDQTYHTAKQVTRSLGISILENIDEIVTSGDRARLFRRRVIYAPAAIAVLLGAVGLCCGAAYLSIEDPRAYRRAMSGPRYFMQRIGITETAAETARTDPPQETAPAIAMAGSKRADSGP